MKISTTPKCIISYLYHITPIEGKAYNFTPFSFRIHNIERSADAKQIREQILRERAPIPANCCVEVYQ